MKKIIILAVIFATAISCGNKKTVQPVPDAPAIELIQAFYENYVFGGETVTDEVAAQYCTPGLIQKLLEDYDYDVPGYAVWDFSKSEAGDNVWEGDVDVEPLGKGQYKVCFTENGERKSVNVTLVADGDKILFDKID